MQMNEMSSDKQVRSQLLEQGQSPKQKSTRYTLSSEVVNNQVPETEIDPTLSATLELNSFSFGKAIKNGLRLLCTRRVLLSILLGQVLAALICLTAVCSEVLVRNNANIPATQTFINYWLLAVVFGSATAFGFGDEPFCRVLRRRGLFYFLVAIADVEANFMMVTAYQYTSIASVQILDCSTIPTVLLLSFFVFGARIGALHLIGVLLALAGVASLIVADSITGKYNTGVSRDTATTYSPLINGSMNTAINSSVLLFNSTSYLDNSSTALTGSTASNNDGYLAILGDILCIAGAALYGVSNVAQEYTVKRHSVIEYLGMLGGFGSLVNGIQLAVLESSALTLIDWSNFTGVLLPLGGFAAAMFSLSIIFAFVVRRSSAAVVNLNVLTADLYALLCGVVLFNYSVHALYALAFVLILAGVLLYLVREPTISDRRAARFERFVCKIERLLCIAEASPTTSVKIPADGEAQRDRDTSYSQDAPYQQVADRSVVASNDRV